MNKNSLQVDQDLQKSYKIAFVSKDKEELIQYLLTTEILEKINDHYFLYEAKKGGGE